MEAKLKLQSIKCFWCKNSCVVGERTNSKGHRLFLCVSHYRMIASLHDVTFYGSASEQARILYGSYIQ